MMDAAPMAMAFNPDPQILLIVTAGVSLGSPARIMACRAVFWPCAACSTFPMMTSSMAIGVAWSSQEKAFFSSSIIPWSLSLSGALAFMASSAMGRKPAFFNTSFITTAPSSTTGTFIKAPPKFPMAVREPLTITTSLIEKSSITKYDYSKQSWPTWPKAWVVLTGIYGSHTIH